MRDGRSQERRAGHASWTVTHDFDGDGKSDLNDKDADNDGLDDGWEDWNLNATTSSTNETDPYDNDTDDDHLLDGAEPSIFVDSDGDGSINGRDTNSNGDSYTDDLQVWVVFRTNAADGEPRWGPKDRPFADLGNLVSAR